MNNVYVLKGTDKALYMAKDDYKKLQNNDWINDYVVRHLMDDKTVITINDVCYYDLNLILKMLFSSDKALALKLLEACETAGFKKQIWTFIYDKIKDFQNDEIYDNCYNAVISLQKLENHEDCSDVVYGCGNFSDTYLEYMLDELAAKVKLDVGYFIEKKESALENALKKASFSPHTVTSAYVASRIFATIIKDEPFKEHNAEAAVVITNYFLNDLKALKLKYRYNGVYDNYQKVNVSSSDYLLAYKLVSENKDKNIDELGALILPLFNLSDFACDTEVSQKLSLVKAHNTVENVYAYILSFTEHFHGVQGYYEYFGQGEKLHYNGKYFNFTLNLAQSNGPAGLLVFDCRGLAHIECPSFYKHQAAFIEALYLEIKKRSYKDIMSHYLETLKQALNNLFDVSNLKITFNVKWDYEIDSNVEL